MNEYVIEWSREYEIREKLYDLGYTTGTKNILEKLLNMKRPTKEDMRIMLRELKQG